VTANDAVYNIAGAPFAADNAGTDIGNEVDFVATYKASETVSAHIAESLCHCCQMGVWRERAPLIIRKLRLLPIGKIDIRIESSCLFGNEDSRTNVF